MEKLSLEESYSRLEKISYIFIKFLMNLLEVTKTDKISLDLVNLYHGKIKIDNHPTLELQYASLYNYILFIMEELPIRIMKKYQIEDISKYKGLDFDGNLERRLKNSYRF